MKAEVFKHMIAESTTNSATDGIVEAFHHATGDPFIEVVQELIPVLKQQKIQIGFNKLVDVKEDVGRRDFFLFG